MNYLQIEFVTSTKDESEILVALLAETGFESFEETDHSLKAFIKEDGFTEIMLDDILKMVPVKFTITVLPQQNWNAQWERSFQPIVINNFVAVRAGFHPPVSNVKHEIIITPKMSFGTGHHATTYMMIEQMETLDLSGKTIADFGTGTAVLAILAEKMGALSIDAIDHDEWSIQNSIENAAANNCFSIELIKAETILTGKVYDMILANINLNVIMENLAAIKNVCKKGSIILLSGFIRSDETVLINALSEWGINNLNTIQKDEWICLLAEVN